MMIAVLSVPSTVKGHLLVPVTGKNALQVGATLRAQVHAQHPELGALQPVQRRAAGWVAPRAVAVHITAPQDGMTAPRLPIAELRRTTLRPHQVAALQAWRRGVVVGSRCLPGHGVVVAPCGAGKTTIGLAAAAVTPTRTLVLVHTKDLAEQWRTRAELELGRGSVAVHGEKPARVLPRIVIATLQGLARMTPAALERWGASFGLVVLDEAHHAPAATWSKVIMALPARHRLALTATPEREDGRTPLLHAHFGPTVHETALADLERKGLTLAPTIHQVQTGWSPQDGMRADEDLDDPKRNQLVTRIVAEKVGQGRCVLLLVRRVEHAAELHAALRRKRVIAHLVTGEVPAADRKKRLAEVARRTVRVLVATSVGDEGLDLPVLDTVVLAAPSAVLGRVQQRIGRALRPAPGKKPPEVIDLVDAHADARAAAESRRELYRGLGWRLA